MPARRGNESDQLETYLPKVRLISQPDFGHDLRKAQLTIADLSGRVTQGEIAERTARGTIENLRERVESLEGELSELQEAENIELQNLGSQCTQYYRENLKLVREISLKDIQMKSMDSLLRKLKPVSYANGQTSLLDEDSAGDNSSLDKASQPLGPHFSGSVCVADWPVEPTSNDNPEPAKASDSENADLFERESSLLRELAPEPVRYQQVLYPVDAVTDKEAKRWFPQAFKLVGVDLGPHYAEFLGHWIHFERLHKWKKSGGRLTGFGRPEVISKWIKEGRYPPRCSEPVIGADQTQQYLQEMCAWWKQMRPATVFDPDNLGDDWAALDKHGINGWLSIVAGMKWWGESMKFLTSDSLRTSTEDWLSMLKEHTEIVRNLHTYLEKDITLNTS